MDDRLLEIFRAESEERVARMCAVLLAAEADSGGTADDIDSLFRDVHSIKGSAGMFGFDAIGVLAGSMEVSLADARQTGSLPGSLVPRLLQATDAIRAALQGDTTTLQTAQGGLREPDSVRTGAPSTGDPAAPGTPRTEPARRTLRVGAEKVDRLLATVGEAALHQRRLDHLVGGESGTDAARQELERGESLITDLQDAVLGLRTLPLETIVGTLPRALRDVAAESGRDVRLELDGTDTPLDRSVLDGIAEVLVHLLRNAVSHGVEPPDERRAAGKPVQGVVRITAGHRGGLVAITCADDGRGVSAELIAQSAQRGGSLAGVLAEAGFSTAQEVSELSGRGVGLDAVKRHVEGLGGALEVDSTPGKGTAVTLLLPLTLAILPVFIVERGGHRFGLPLASVHEALRGAPVHELHGKRSLQVAGDVVPLADLADVLGTDAPALPDDPPVVLLGAGGRRAALACDRLHGDQEAVVKPLGAVLGTVPGYLGGAVLGDGRIALLLDPARLVRTVADATASKRAPTKTAHRTPKVLVVDDQFTVRELERTILEAAGYRVATAGDGRAALELLNNDGDVDVVVSDIEMPGMDGLAMLEAIRGQPRFSSLPVVIVSSQNDDASRQRGAAAGADAWVVKSQFDQQTLLETVSGLVDLR
ncbi:MAG: CheA signal transduction histidine kinase [Solirubrobacterales bacterium]|nr:CheA signal transduction histidine kinase [Solirubrobacterales bacterium]